MNGDEEHQEWIGHFTRQVGSGPGLLREMTSAFLIEVPEILDNLKVAFANQDAPRIRRYAHSLKSCLRYVSAGEEVGAAGRIEAAATNAELASVECEFNQVVLSTQLWIEKLKRFQEG
jgi:HPt (histidine-containing phosphotransfer) domain-containing protein